MKVVVVVPWHNPDQIKSFCEAWNIDPSSPPDDVVLKRDEGWKSCARTKNEGIAEAMRMNAETVVVLDDDCYPEGEITSLSILADAHLMALEPVSFPMFDLVTSPPSRGTPFLCTTVRMPVAASMGFWTNVGDYCAVRQLAFDCAPMKFERKPIFARYFPLCGMNIAFNPEAWLPWCRFIDVPRFDDIWMGWLWQREAYRRNHCFNLAGPVVRHSRQSNAWTNLRQESQYLERNDTLWKEIATHPSSDYQVLRQLLPC